MVDTVLILLSLLFIKHYYVDFIDQTNDEVKYKGIYLHLDGVGHSISHGSITAVLLCFFTTIEFAFFIGFCEILVHYHIDYVKTKYGNKDIQNSKFWYHLGLDQLLHYLTYLGIAKIIL